jgi:hypothetical protein
MAPDQCKLLKEKWFMSYEMKDGNSVWFEDHEVYFDSEIRKTLEVKQN